MKSRNIFIGIILVLCLVLGVGGYFIVSKSSQSSSTGSELANTGYADPETYEEGKGIYVSSEGVGKLKDGVPTLEIYLDYTCKHCVDFEKEYGEQIEKLVTDGKLNVIYRPVNVLNQEYSKYVASAVLEVVNSKDKDKFMAFQHAVTKNVAEVFESRDDSKAGVEYVDVLAKNVGISEDTIKLFANKNYNNYIDTTVQLWTKRPLFEGQQIGTPSFVLDGKIIGVDELTKSGDIASAVL